MAKPSLTKDEKTELQISIINHLKVGHKNATPLKELSARIGVNERKIRLAIESLRLEGYDLIFFPDSPTGYGFSETEDEIQVFYEYLKSRVINECRVMRAIKTAKFNKYHKTVGQLKLLI
jgi:hypothetical protein